MSKKKERSRQEQDARQQDRQKELDQEDFSSEEFSRSHGRMDDDQDVPDHNPNVDKSADMKRKERDNIE